jgi:phage terminase large subunit
MNIKIPKAFKPLFVPKRYKVVYGGRGGAKSASFSRALLVKAMQKQLRILCGREIQHTIADSVKKLLDDIIKQYELEGFYSSTNTEITGKNGSSFIFAGLKHNPLKIKSMEGIDIAWVEEADALSQESLDILIPTIRRDDSELWFSYNPRDENDPVHKMFVKEGRPNAWVRKINYDENPWFPDVLRQEMEYDKSHDLDKYQHIWLGETLKLSEALVFRNKWRIEEFEMPPGTLFLYGADWGFSQDPTTLIRFSIDEAARVIYVDYEAYGVGVEIYDIPKLFDMVPGCRKWPIKADNARPDTISYLKKKHGFNIKGAKKGAGSVEDGIEFLKSFIIIVHPRCKNTAYELGSYKYKVDAKSGDILPLLEDKNNHLIDPMRYAVRHMYSKKEAKLGK